MVDVDLLENFLSTIIPKDARLPMSDLFAQFREKPNQVFNSGFYVIQLLIRETETISAAAVNGIAFGILIARISEDPDWKKVFNDWLEEHARAQGENVVDFLQRKAKH